MKSYGQWMCRRLIGIAALFLLNLSPIDAEEPTLARLSFWVPPERMGEFETMYEEQVVPILQKHDLVESSERGRSTVDSVFSRLFTMKTPSEVADKNEALQNDPMLKEVLQDLGVSFGTDDSIRYNLGIYSVSEGTGGASIGKVEKAGNGKTVKAGSGFRKGLWQDFGVADGLPSPFVYDILQDRKGSIWFGTWGGGVVRFDGEQFFALTTDDGLADNTERVEVVYEDRQGTLWFGTGGAGVSRYDGQQFTTFTTEDGLADNRITAIVEDAEGKVWFGTTKGITCFDGHQLTTYTAEDGLAGNGVWCTAVDQHEGLWFGTWDGGISRFFEDEFVNFTTEQGLPHNRVMSVLTDQRGRLWLGTPEGLCRYDGKMFTTFTTEDGLTKNWVTGIAEDIEGNLWLTHANDGVSHYEGKRFKTFTTHDGLVHNSVWSILGDSQGFVWFGTGGGLGRYNAAQIDVFTAGDGLANNWINSIYEDRTGDLWFGTQAGIARYDGNQFVTYGVEDGLAGELIGAIIEDRRGNLWVATGRQDWSSVGGVSRFDGATFTTFSSENAPAGDFVCCIIEDREGNLWFGSDDAGVTRYDGEVFTRLSTEQGLPSEDVNALLEDRAGNLWIGTSAGLARFDGQQFTVFTAEDGLASDGVSGLMQDRGGNLWIRGQGVTRYDGQEFTAFTIEDGLAHNLVLSIHEDRQGYLWFATFSGASRFDGERFTNFTPENTPIGLLLVDIVEDRNGHLWFGANGGGVCQYDGLVFQSLSQRDGLANNAVQSLHVANNGDIWVATEAGITRYRPSHTPPAIRLVNVLADSSYGSIFQISLPSSQDVLIFEYQGRSFNTPLDQLAYVYRLEGYDEVWRQTRKNQVEYTDLPVGKYAFQVKAVDRDLNYSEEPATVDIEVYHQPVSSSIRISELNIQNVFSSFFKTYAEKPVGSVLVTNDDTTPVEATLSFFIPDHMRRPTEEQTILLEPQSSQVVSLHAILDEEILDLKGATPAQAEVALSCKLGEQKFSIQESENITIYGRGALTWDPLGKATAFITPTDHNVSAFSRSLFERYRSHIKKRDINGNIPTAMLLFEALSSHGIKYAKDASTPYSQVRGDRSAIDNIQYPSELLQSKMGDCDDCTVLYCALLENLDIPTALIDHPNHILMMFDSGIKENQLFGFSIDEDRYVERDGRFWIPVEVTKLGEGSFMEAWELGAKTCQRLQNLDELVTDVRKVSPDYPYALPSIEEEIKPPDSEELERAFIDDMAQLGMIREEYVERQYIRPLLENPGNHRRRMELAHTLIESEDFNGAISTLMHLLDTDLKAEAFYLIGYVYAGKMDFEAAIRYIEKALEYDPENRGYRYSLEVLKGDLTQ